MWVHTSTCDKTSKFSFLFLGATKRASDSPRFYAQVCQSSTMPSGHKTIRLQFMSEREFGDLLSVVGHGASQFMQPHPGRLVALQPEHSLQSQGAGTVLLSGNPPHGAKPDRQRGPRILEDRPSCH